MRKCGLKWCGLEVVPGLDPMSYTRERSIKLFHFVVEIIQGGTMRPIFRLFVMVMIGFHPSIPPYLSVGKCRMSLRSIALGKVR